VVPVHADGRAIAIVRIELAHGEPALIAGLGDDQRGSAGGPLNRDEIGLVLWQADRGPSPVEVYHVECHIGIGSARDWISVRNGRVVWVDRIGNEDSLHQVDVRSGNHEPRAIRGPPVATIPAHLLGRQELGQSPGDLRIFFAGETTVVARPVNDVEGSPGDVGDPAPSWVGPGVEHRTCCGQLRNRARFEVSHK
jgi:hypothetical protein